MNRRSFLRAVFLTPLALTVAGCAKPISISPYAKTTVPPCAVYGRIQISGKVIQSAVPSVFEEALDFEIDRLRCDMRRAYLKAITDAS